MQYANFRTTRLDFIAENSNLRDNILRGRIQLLICVKHFVKLCILDKQSPWNKHINNNFQAR